MAIESKIIYFANPGAGNTDEVFRIAKRRAEELGIKTIVVASDTGDTAVKAVKTFKGLRVVAVSLVHGMRQPDYQEFTEENRTIIESNGGKVITATHVFGGVCTALREKFQTLAVGDIIAHTLRVFGHGMKVTLQIAMMAADAGLVRTDEDIISIAGEKKGADTAIVLKPVNAHRFFDIKVREILCKPRF